ncbi:MAG TPA: DUF3883 domain-containing protein [Chloroflexia bacterium]|nr:DUF3883 domain-containing protein [Chloroflexia bacterium]
MKLSNFASIDPNHPGRALYRGGQGDRDVWEEFISNPEGLAREVARIRRQLGAIEQPIDEEDYHTPIPELVEVHQYIAQRAGRKSSGQGYSVDPGTRRAIELHAMNFAIEYYIARGWHVEDVSATMSYDLRCTQPTLDDTDELHVEVKGTTSRGSGVLLTPNEVIHARTYSNVALCIVSEIIVTRNADQLPIATGGTMRIIYPWDINVGQLTAVGYEYTIPPNDI